MSVLGGLFTTYYVNYLECVSSGEQGSLENHLVELENGLDAGKLQSLCRRLKYLHEICKF